MECQRVEALPEGRLCCTYMTYVSQGPQGPRPPRIVLSWNSTSTPVTSGSLGECKKTTPLRGPACMGCRGRSSTNDTHTFEHIHKEAKYDQESTPGQKSANVSLSIIRFGPLLSILINTPGVCTTILNVEFPSVLGVLGQSLLARYLLLTLA